MSPDGIAWHTLPIEAIVSLHISNLETGLSDKEAHRRHAVLLESGHHVPAPESLHRIRPQGAVLAAGLLLAALAAALYQYWVLLFILGVLAAASTAWALQETEQSRRINELLRRQFDWRARVLRNGHLLRVVPSELVPGDIIAVVAGDFVPADARLFAADNLTCLQTPIFSSAGNTQKHPTGVDTQAPLEERSSMLYFGTYVTSGSGRAIVVSTGGDTTLASLIKPLSETSVSPSRLLEALPNMNILRRSRQPGSSLGQSATSGAQAFKRS